MIEVLIVLAILAIMAAGASGGISAAVPALRLKAETRMLADGLRATRRAAILQRHEASVTLLQDGYISSNEQVEHSLPAGTRLVLAGPRQQAESRISFFADGSSTGGRLRLELGERRSGVSVDWLTGRVTVDD